MKRRRTAETVATTMEDDNKTPGIPLYLSIIFHFRPIPIRPF